MVDTIQCVNVAMITRVRSCNNRRVREESMDYTEANAVTDDYHDNRTYAITGDHLTAQCHISHLTALEISVDIWTRAGLHSPWAKYLGKQVLAWLAPRCPRTETPLSTACHDSKYV